MVIYNRVDCCKERLFPFEILVTDEFGKVRKCQGKSFNIKDKEIPSAATNPIRIDCGNLRGNSVKLVGKKNEYINICEVEIFGKAKIWNEGMIFERNTGKEKQLIFVSRK